MPSIADKVNSALNGGKMGATGNGTQLYGEVPMDGLVDEGGIEDEDEDVLHFESEEEYNHFMQKRYEEFAIDPSEASYLPCPTNLGMRCGICANFAENTTEIVTGFLHEGVAFVSNVAYGECHAAPAIDPENPTGPAVFPIVPGYQWCGNWKIAPQMPLAPMGMSEEIQMMDEDSEEEPMDESEEFPEEEEIESAEANN